MELTSTHPLIIEFQKLESYKRNFIKSLFLSRYDKKYKEEKEVLFIKVKKEIYNYFDNLDKIQFSCLRDFESKVRYSESIIFQKHQHYCSFEKFKLILTFLQITPTKKIIELSELFIYLMENYKPQLKTNSNNYSHHTENILVQNEIILPTEELAINELDDDEFKIYDRQIVYLLYKYKVIPFLVKEHDHFKGNKTELARFIKFIIKSKNSLDAIRTPINELLSNQFKIVNIEPKGQFKDFLDKIPKT